MLSSPVTLEHSYMRDYSNDGHQHRVNTHSRKDRLQASAYTARQAPSMQRCQRLTKNTTGKCATSPCDAETPVQPFRECRLTGCPVKDILTFQSCRTDLHMG